MNSAKSTSNAIEVTDGASADATPDLATFGGRIRYARTKCRMSQRQLAQQFDLTQGSTSLWERNESQPRLEFLPKLCSILGITLQWLLVGDGPLPEFRLFAKVVTLDERRAGLSHLQLAALDAIEHAMHRGAVSTEQCIALISEWQPK